MAAMAAVHDLGHVEEDHGAQEFQELRSILNDPVNHFMTSSVIFDPQEELLWVGSQSVSEDFKVLKISDPIRFGPHVGLASGQP